MYTSIRRPHVLDSYFFRWMARASAAVLVVAWLALVIAEVFRSHYEAPSVHSVYQAIALAIVFAGYAIGWWKEMVGGVIAILGTAAFFAVNALTLETLPDPAAALFAVPGVLYLLAWQYERKSLNG
ncbi:MAG: hypothetical protein WD229_08785 [Pirellulales bacterium]